MNALLSIHDVTPDTIERVERIINALPNVCRQKLILLVVPGLPWTISQIEQLASWQRAGMELAGHGWIHSATHITSFYHRLHSALISRDAAEHLSLNRDQLMTLVHDSFAWFAEHNLRRPTLYVPPAWALGRLNTQDLRNLPFKYYETTSGIYSAEQDRHITLPLVGFEADTLFRQHSLMIWNSVNMLLGRHFGCTRIGIHPFDFDYRLKNQIIPTIQRSEYFLQTFELFDPPKTVAGKINAQ